MKSTSINRSMPICCTPYHSALLFSQIEKYSEDIYYFKCPYKDLISCHSLQYLGIKTHPNLQKEWIRIKILKTPLLLEDSVDVAEDILDCIDYHCPHWNNFVSFKTQKKYNKPFPYATLSIVTENPIGNWKRLQFQKNDDTDTTHSYSMSQILSAIKDALYGLHAFHNRFQWGHLGICPMNLWYDGVSKIKIEDFSEGIQFRSIFGFLKLGKDGFREALQIINNILNDSNLQSSMAFEIISDLVQLKKEIEFALQKNKITFPPNWLNYDRYSWYKQKGQMADLYSMGESIKKFVWSRVIPEFQSKTNDSKNASYSPLLEDLLEGLVHFDPLKRRKCCQCLCHPIFWKIEDTFLILFHCLMLISNQVYYRLPVSRQIRKNCYKIGLCTINIKNERYGNGLNFYQLLNQFRKDYPIMKPEKKMTINEILLFLGLFSIDVSYSFTVRRNFISSLCNDYPELLLKAAEIAVYPFLTGTTPYNNHDLSFYEIAFSFYFKKIPKFSKSLRAKSPEITVRNDNPTFNRSNLKSLTTMGDSMQLEEISQYNSLPNYKLQESTTCEKCELDKDSKSQEKEFSELNKSSTYADNSEGKKTFKNSINHSAEQNLKENTQTEANKVKNGKCHRIRRRYAIPTSPNEKTSKEHNVLTDCTSKENQKNNSNTRALKQKQPKPFELNPNVRPNTFRTSNIPLLEVDAMLPQQTKERCHQYSIDALAKGFNEFKKYYEVNSIFPS